MLRKTSPDLNNSPNLNKSPDSDHSLDLDYSFTLAGEMISGKGEDSFYMDNTEDAAIAAVFDGCGGIGSRQYPCFKGHTGAYMSARAISGALHDWFHDTFHDRPKAPAGERAADAKQAAGAEWDAGTKRTVGTGRTAGEERAAGTERAAVAQRSAGAAKGRPEGKSSEESDSEKMTEEIGERFCKAVGLLHSMADAPSRLSGALVREFPSTAAAAIVRPGPKGRRIDCIWAGDSRIYLLDEDGLAQLTQDDVAGLDAMENLRKDGALTNMVAADGRFLLHHKIFYTGRPVAVIAATDGCFGYVSTPMDFEYLLLSSLIEAGTPPEFEGNLRQQILETAGDDYTLGFMCFGFDSFKQLQKALKNRYVELRKKYIEPLRRDGTEKTAQRLWQDYRKNYLRCQ